MTLASTPACDNHVDFERFLGNATVDERYVISSVLSQMSSLLQPYINIFDAIKNCGGQCVGMAFGLIVNETRSALPKYEQCQNDSSPWVCEDEIRKAVDSHLQSFKKEVTSCFLGVGMVAGSMSPDTITSSISSQIGYGLSNYVHNKNVAY